METAVSKDWVLELAKKYSVQPKEIRDALWPRHPKKSLSYLDNVKNPGSDMLVKIADKLGCSVDELLRRPAYPYITGDNNHVGNINVNSDYDCLNNVIVSQQSIIRNQIIEIKRLHEQYSRQLKTKEDEIKAANERIDRLIKLAQDGGNQ